MEANYSYIIFMFEVICKPLKTREFLFGVVFLVKIILHVTYNGKTSRMRYTEKYISRVNGNILLASVRSECVTMTKFMSDIFFFCICQILNHL